MRINKRNRKDSGMNRKRWIEDCNNVKCKIWKGNKLRRKKRFVMETTTTESYQQEHQQ